MFIITKIPVIRIMNQFKKRMQERACAEVGAPESWLILASEPYFSWRVRADRVVARFDFVETLEQVLYRCIDPSVARCLSVRCIRKLELRQVQFPQAISYIRVSLL